MSEAAGGGPEGERPDISGEWPTAASTDLHRAAWPDMFANLQAAYSELTSAQWELEHRAAEIQEARALVQRVLDSMSEALFVMDWGGTVVRVNRAALDLLERPEEEIVGRPLSELLGEEVPATAWRLLEGSGSGRLSGVDVEVSRPGDRRLALSLSAAVVRDQEGKVTGVMAVARDVTDRKRAEEALERQARELARSNAELEQFAYVASHDLQEPIRMVASFAELLERRHGERLDGDAEEFLEYIVDGAHRMRSLVNDLLAFSRVGRDSREFEPVSCERVVEEVLTDLRSTAEECGAEIEVRPLPTVRGDETRLYQLFQNLIGNALKFRSEERPPRVEVGARRRTGTPRWELWVRDNGIGIDPEYGDRLFLIFQRLHGRKYEGTGIGLALCKKIVEHHGGEIRVESVPGEGSTFYFTLPGAETGTPENQRAERSDGSHVRS